MGQGITLDTVRKSQGISFLKLTGDPEWAWANNQTDIHTDVTAGWKLATHKEWYRKWTNKMNSKEARVIYRSQCWHPPDTYSQASQHCQTAPCDPKCPNLSTINYCIVNRYHVTAECNYIK